jgi:hypothetical protein
MGPVPVLQLEGVSDDAAAVLRFYQDCIELARRERLVFWKRQQVLHRTSYTAVQDIELRKGPQMGTLIVHPRHGEAFSLTMIPLPRLLQAETFLRDRQIAVYAAGDGGITP